MNYLYDFLKSHSDGNKSTLYSCCSANEDVLVAAILKAKQTDSVLLVEATANQVNQFGGYTNKTPKEFADFVRSLADTHGLPQDALILGGDHLGPLVWCNQDEHSAMALAEELVRLFVAAGYQKIHLDTSMRLASDNPSETFPVSICAKRGAYLCRACEEEFNYLKSRNPDAKAPVYVIGSEVPVPGGDAGNSPSGNITTPIDYDVMLAAYKQAFEEEGVGEAFDRVLAVVVEMGVEFSEYSISEYNRENFKTLANHASNSRIGFEAHSTDYQRKEHLAQMCEDGAVILKVGPAFTFAARSALFKLELIEKELVNQRYWSNYRKALDSTMLADSSKWKSYYKGSEQEQAFARAFSFSDRCRYYFDCPNVKQAHDCLLNNLNKVVIPHCLVAELFPKQYERIRSGLLECNTQNLLYDSIGDAIDDYLFATNNNKIGSNNE